MGDVNSEENVIFDENYKQIIQDSTTCGVFGGKLNHIYANLKDFSVNGKVLFKCFTRSKHHPVCAILEKKTY